MTCAGVSISTNCQDYGDIDECYKCQNNIYMTVLQNPGSLESVDTGYSNDIHLLFRNEAIITFYLTIGIIGILTSAYYIR